MSSSSTTPALRVYEPGRRGLPPMRRYIGDLWRRRSFAYFVARADLKARHFDTWFGQLWIVLNPLLLASIYFLLIGVIFSRGGGLELLTRIIAGLFAFYFTRNAVAAGASSVVGGGALVTSTALPRAILPLSSTITAVQLYLPTLLVYAVFHLVGGQPVTSALLLAPVVVLLHTVFNLGLAMFFGALNVYFRDVQSFLPYVLRIWLYLSPVLYRPASLPDNAPEWVTVLLWLNPLTPMLELWHTVLDGSVPGAGLWLGSLAWAVGALIVGGWFFMSREREFAVRV